MDAVSPRYFETLGTPVMLGREFREEDNPTAAIEPPTRFIPGQDPPEPPGPKVIVVNQAFARRFLWRTQSHWPARRHGRDLSRR